MVLAEVEEWQKPNERDVEGADVVEGEDKAPKMERISARIEAGHERMQRCYVEEGLFERYCSETGKAALFFIS